jgi:hypothetical protein
VKKVYFACSVRGGRDDAAIYAHIVTLIKPFAKVLTEVFTDGNLTPMGGNGTVEAIRKQDMIWLQKADAVIAEVTSPSLGVGFELATAEQLGKPILALYRPQEGRRLSAVIAGSPHIEILVYNEVDELELPIQEFVAALSQPNSA